MEQFMVNTVVFVYIKKQFIKVMKNTIFIKLYVVNLLMVIYLEKVKLQKEILIERQQLEI